MDRPAEPLCGSQETVRWVSYAVNQGSYIAAAAIAISRPVTPPYSAGLRLPFPPGVAGPTGITRVVIAHCSHDGDCCAEMDRIAQCPSRWQPRTGTSSLRSSEWRRAGWREKQEVEVSGKDGKPLQPPRITTIRCIIVSPRSEPLLVDGTPVRRTDETGS